VRALRALGGRRACLRSPSGACGAVPFFVSHLAHRGARLVSLIDLVLTPTRTPHVVQASEWIQRINADVLAGLREISPDHKFASTTLVTENSGAGLHSFSSTLWNESSDGQLFVVWENPSVRVVVTVFAAAL
jgi:hypothetical protein